MFVPMVLRSTNSAAITSTAPMARQMGALSTKPAMAKHTHEIAPTVMT